MTNRKLLALRPTNKTAKEEEYVPRGDTCIPLSCIPNILFVLQRPSNLDSPLRSPPNMVTHIGRLRRDQKVDHDMTGWQNSAPNMAEH